MTALLSILIPTTPERQELTKLLTDELKRQCNELKEYEVQIIVYLTERSDKGGPSIGAKRQEMLENSWTPYVVFADSDDSVSADYVLSILDGCKSGSDVVTFNGWITTDGIDKTDWFIGVGMPYVTSFDENGRKIYTRHPNHLCAIKRDIAMKVGYIDSSFQEDYYYSVKLKESGLITTEYKIHKQLYFYKYITHK